MQGIAENRQEMAENVGFWRWRTILVTLRQDLAGIHECRLAAEKAEKKPFRTSWKSNP